MPGNQKYPWHIWADGQNWSLAAGVDYECSTEAIIDSARRYARRHNLRLHRLRTTAGVQVEFWARDEMTLGEAVGQARLLLGEAERNWRAAEIVRRLRDRTGIGSGLAWQALMWLHRQGQLRKLERQDRYRYSPDGDPL